MYRNSALQTECVKLMVLLGHLTVPHYTPTRRCSVRPKQGRCASAILPKRGGN